MQTLLVGPDDNITATVSNIGSSAACRHSVASYCFIQIEFGTLGVQQRSEIRPGRFGKSLQLNFVS